MALTKMTEAEQLVRKTAYIEAVRARHRGARNCGFVACVLGVVMLLTGRYMAGAPAVLLWAGVAVIAIGWGLFAFSIVGCIAYVRAHPFEETG